jgi:hypothetical protein
MKKVTMPINIGKPVPKLEISKDLMKLILLRNCPEYLGI